MPHSRPALLFSLSDSPLVSLFSLMHTETKPTGLPLIRNMQIHLLISYIESLRLSVNTWLALILAWYGSRTPQVTGVNCSPRADSQLSYSIFFPIVYTLLPAEVPSRMQDLNSWATFKVFIENNRPVREGGSLQIDHESVIWNCLSFAGVLGTGSDLSWH